MKERSFIQNEKNYKVYSLCLFVCVWIYLIFRAFFNEPLHDEVATFFNYIEPGGIFGAGVVQDAQNHLLNSYTSRMMYLLFGDHFFCLRIPNLLAFSIYFYGIYQLSSWVHEVRYRYIFISALSTVSFFIEYFAYTRGYGLGLAFFTWVLLYSLKWVHQPSVRNAALLYCFAYFAIFSNLIYTGSIFLVMTLIVVYHLKKIRQFTLKENALLTVLHIGFTLSILPFLWLGYILKTGGGLYYGSLKGFWEVTGKTLTKNVFFYDGDWMKYGFIAFLVYILIYLLIEIKKMGFWKQFEEKETIIAYYFFGNIAIILLLAFLLNVNYPEDRVGMYLIPLFLLLFVLLVQKSKKTRFLLFLLLFFPVSFLIKMNLHTSVFSPDDRMTDTFYYKVRSQISAENTVALYPLMALTWSLHERHHKGVKINTGIERDFNPNYDVILTKRKRLKSSDPLSDYILIAEDKSSSFVAFKRKRPFQKRLLLEKKISVIRTKDKAIKIFDCDSIDFQKHRRLNVQISGHISIGSSFKKLRFIIQTSPTDKIETLSQRWLQGPKKQDFPVDINYVVNDLNQVDKKLLIYIWNPEGRLITFKNANTKIFEIKP